MRDGSRAVAPGGVAVNRLDGAASETIDELVRVGDGRLHIRCVGVGDTTVLLIAGFNDGGDNWGEIEAALARQARVCSYARFGTGASNPPTQSQTFATSARDLHALMAEIGQRGPYVVVGHSYGGGEAVTFASRYRTEVTTSRSTAPMSSSPRSEACSRETRPPRSALVDLALPPSGAGCPR